MSNQQSGLRLCPIIDATFTWQLTRRQEHAQIHGYPSFSIYREKRECFKVVFGVAATAMVLLPRELDSSCRTLLVGFSDGTVRALLRCGDGFKLASAFKPHKVGINVASI